MAYMTEEEGIKEIAKRIDSGKCFEIENPTKEDILNLEEFDYILTQGADTEIIIRRSYEIANISEEPLVVWNNGKYDIVNTLMKTSYDMLTVDEVLSKMKSV